MDIYQHAAFAFSAVAAGAFQRLFPDDAACATTSKKARWGDGLRLSNLVWGRLPGAPAKTPACRRPVPVATRLSRYETGLDLPINWRAGMVCPDSGIRIGGSANEHARWTKPGSAVGHRSRRGVHTKVMVACALRCAIASLEPRRTRRKDGRYAGAFDWQSPRNRRPNRRAKFVDGAALRVQ